MSRGGRSSQAKAAVALMGPTAVQVPVQRYAVSLTELPCMVVPAYFSEAWEMGRGSVALASCWLPSAPVASRSPAGGPLVGVPPLPHLVAVVWALPAGLSVPAVVVPSVASQLVVAGAPG